MKMCIVIDANVAHRFTDLADEDATAVKDWIEEKPGRLVAGGKNIVELTRLAWMRRWLTTLSRAGRLRRITDAAVNEEETRVVHLNICQSDDPHVIALARTSGARILFSHDRDLHQDFGNKNLLDNPRGCVYQCLDHRHLLDDRNCTSQLSETPRKTPIRANKRP